MKCKVGKEHWNGTQPISWFTEYYITFFRNLSDEIDVLELLLSISRKVDEIKIEIIYSKSPISQLAYIHPFKKIIYIEETLLSFMWLTCFSTLANFDELIQKKALSRDQDLALQNKSNEAFKYALTLLDRYSEWDIKNLVNPALHGKRYENYINLTTQYFQYSFMFIIVHEFSHGLIGHDIPFQDKKIKDEYDADLLAFQLLLKSTLLEEEYKFKRDGAILGLCSILMINSAKNSTTYPETADRIKVLIEFIKPSSDEWIWGMCGMNLQNWLIHNIDSETEIPKKFSDYVSYFYFMYDLVKKVN